MVAEYSANAIQNMLPGAPLLFTESPVPCTRGLIFYRDGSGIFRLASPRTINGIVTCGCPCRRRIAEAVYDVEFHANIAVPEGETVGEISLAVSIDGVVDASSIMRTTPTAVDAYENVGTALSILVPAVCGCESISIINNSDIPINAQNANLTITYEGIRA